ncbi:MAG: TIGR03620 family F420-dependent LLM class oxidoreductase [Pseudomonadota bacterium]
MTLGVLFNTDRLDAREFTHYAQRIEDLGIESLWLPELFTRDPFAASGYLLARTQRLKLATGIANIYARDPAATVSSASTLQEMSDGRFILGLGVSNAGLNRARGHAWEKPIGKLTEYLEGMQAVKLTTRRYDAPVHVAAHGPKMLATAASHADGANTYLMPADHAMQARQALGPEAALNTMMFCLLDDNPHNARETARKAVAYYTGLDYYHRAWRECGFADADFADGGSDALIDAIVAWGDINQIRARIAQQYENGASRVVVIPVGAGLGGQPDWQLLEQLVD